MSNRIIHVADMRNYPDAVYIGRAMPRRGLQGSIWGNPYRGSREVDGESFGPCELYERYLLEGEGRHLLLELPALRDKPLACWCVRDGDPERKPGDPYRCHGDVLADLLAGYSDDDLVDLAVQP